MKLQLTGRPFDDALESLEYFVSGILSQPETGLPEIEQQPLLVSSDGEVPVAFVIETEAFHVPIDARIDIIVFQGRRPSDHEPVSRSGFGGSNGLEIISITLMVFRSP
ncbi:hypothetical protein [Pseudomonas aeruginosa]|uniref:hypothetical protein n=1 Tax=Pseudomonas aeruginosa TaxID=287 RepID=UPI00129860E5|nr:hypothetical protein [Pseudomonas aeruginosa]MBX5688864.1 hypothetical protein [Pseudomonas aeruginosa]MBX5791850.1 hypothetical protein [Pseudomonas aeruginosa]MCV4097277.1 hypothetical protein [Pseudomonas aeruginosa]MDP5670206.1 hypothetical protein [Pseudomonas aeruginosa]